MCVKAYNLVQQNLVCSTTEQPITYNIVLNVLVHYLLTCIISLGFDVTTACACTICIVKHTQTLYL